MVKLTDLSFICMVLKSYIFLKLSICLSRLVAFFATSSIHAWKDISLVPNRPLCQVGRGSLWSPEMVFIEHYRDVKWIASLIGSEMHLTDINVVHNEIYKSQVGSLLWDSICLKLHSRIRAVAKSISICSAPCISKRFWWLSTAWIAMQAKEIDEEAAEDIIPKFKDMR